MSKDNSWALILVPSPTAHVLPYTSMLIWDSPHFLSLVFVMLIALMGNFIWEQLQFQGHHHHN